MVELDPLLLGSVGFLLSMLFFIGYRILRLHWDESETHRRNREFVEQIERNEQQERERRQQNRPLGWSLSKTFVSVFGVCNCIRPDLLLSIQEKPC